MIPQLSLQRVLFPTAVSSSSLIVGVPHFSIYRSSNPISPSNPALLLPYQTVASAEYKFELESESKSSSTNSSTRGPDNANIMPLQFIADENIDAHFVWLSVYAAIFAIGTTLNCMALWKMRKKKHRDRDQQNHTGVDVCLKTIVCTDLVALFALLILFIVNLNVIPGAQLFTSGFLLRDMMCKGSALVAHAAYSQSMWCWLFMSAMRYMATCRPLRYLAMWGLPNMAVGFMAIFSLLLNGWLLSSVGAGTAGCVANFTVASRVQASLDVIISFGIPLILLLQMDIRVLCHRIKDTDPMLQIVINRPNGERKRICHRFNLIVLTSIMLNVPGNVFRFLTAIGFTRPEEIHPNVLWLFNCLHISQFALNAIYLSSFVYERSQFSKSNSSRHLSISIRQRMEDGGGHLIRERASTISYRANTPTWTTATSPIKNAKSCCDFLCPPANAAISRV